MFHKAIVLTLFLITASIASGQVLIALVLGDKLNSDKLEFGLNAGLQSASISNLNGDRYGALLLGLFFNIKMSEQWSFHPEFNVKSSGGVKGLVPYPVGIPEIDSAFDSGTVTRIMSYGSLPLMMIYKPVPWLRFEAGPYGALLFTTKDQFVYEHDDIEEVGFKNNVTDNYKRLDFGVGAGVTVRLRKGTGVAINLRYTQGMVDVLKENNGPAQKNSSFIIKAEIPIKGNSKNEE